MLGACGQKIRPTPTQECVLGEGRLHLVVEVPRGLALVTSPDVCLLADEADETGAVMVGTLTTDQEGADELLRDPQRFFAEGSLIGESPELVGRRHVQLLDGERELLEWRADLPDLGSSRVGTVVWRRGMRVVVFLVQSQGADSDLPLELLTHFVDVGVEL